MKIHYANKFAWILFPMLISACAQMNTASSQPISREQVVQNLNPIVDMERRSARLTVVMQQLPLVANLTAEDARALKEHYDVYYVYHNAAATSLAEGHLDAYRDQVRVGSQELDSLEAKLKDVAEKSATERRPQRFVPGSGPGFFQ